MLYENLHLAHFLKIFLLVCHQTSKYEHYLICYFHSDLGICRMDRMVSTWFHNVDGCETGLMLPTLIDRCDTLLLLSQRRREGCYCYLKNTILNKLVLYYPNYILIYHFKKFMQSNIWCYRFYFLRKAFYLEILVPRGWVCNDHTHGILHFCRQSRSFQSLCFLYCYSLWECDDKYDNGGNNNSSFMVQSQKDTLYNMVSRFLFD